MVTLTTVDYGNGQGKFEKSTGPPRPASASNKLINTAIAASSFSSVCCGLADLSLVSSNSVLP